MARGVQIRRKVLRKNPGSPPAAEKTVWERFQAFFPCTLFYSLVSFTENIKTRREMVSRASASRSVLPRLLPNARVREQTIIKNNELALFHEGNVLEWRVAPPAKSGERERITVDDLTL